MSIGEIAKIALIDTGLGMGTVFAVLILISIVIWLLGIICRKKPAADTGAEAAEEQAVPAAAEIKDGITPELAAVIAAVAIQQYKKDQGQDTGTEEYIVRNVRRATWKHI